MLSRVLYGGRSVLLLAVAATILAYLVGRRHRPLRRLHRASLADSLLMRAVDLLLAFPPLLFLLLLAAGIGAGRRRSS